MSIWLLFFFFNDTATTEIYTTHNTLSLTTLFRSHHHAARRRLDHRAEARVRLPARSEEHTSELQSLCVISYAVFCLKKKIQQLKQRSQLVQRCFRTTPRRSRPT